MHHIHHATKHFGPLTWLVHLLLGWGLVGWSVAGLAGWLEWFLDWLVGGWVGWLAVAFIDWLGG